MPKYIILRDHIRKSKIPINNHKLIRILIVPQHPIDPIGHQLDMKVGLRSRKEQVYLPILMLQNQFSPIFVRKHSQYRVVRLMLHYHILILNVVVLQSIRVIQVNQEHLSQKILHHLTICLHRKHPLLTALALNLHQMDLVLIIQNSCPAIPHFHLFYIILALNLIHFLPASQQHLLPQPTVKLHSIAQPRGQMHRPQRYATRFKG